MGSRPTVVRPRRLLVAAPGTLWVVPLNATRYKALPRPGVFSEIISLDVMEYPEKGRGPAGDTALPPVIAGRRSRYYACSVKLRVGTSGYGYKEWKGKFYPRDISAREMLPFYSSHFDAVEINNTFYRMPGKELLARWAAQVPDDFVFALKAARIITHIRRLKDAEEETRYLIETAASLGRRLGPILFQLPGSLAKDLSRLEAFLNLLSGTTAAFEFRNPSWLDTETFDLLRARGHALCVSDREPEQLPTVVSTAPWGYLRLRRPGYSDSDLALWLESVAAQPWETAYIFFKHEDQAEGPALAKRFLGLTGLKTSG